jgi:hypothetical protein
MFRNNIFMKYYKKMQCPFGKRGKKKGENPTPPQEQLLGKRRKKRPQPIPLETSKPSPSHVQKLPPQPSPLPFGIIFNPFGKGKKLTAQPSPSPLPTFHL